MTPALVAWLKRARLIGMAIALLSRIALSTKRRDDMTEQTRNEQISAKRNSRCRARDALHRVRSLRRFSHWQRAFMSVCR